MDDLLGNSWLVVAAMIAASILAILYMVSIAIRGQMHAHDLQVSVARLQQQYHARIRAMQEAAQLGEVELVSPIDEQEEKKAA
ncbi:MAG: hypothetical protein U0573_09800 [Phycisphaerales bacterium]